jgi:hypothetical protein
MKLRNLISVGLMATGLAVTAQAQGLYRERNEMVRRVEADRRAVEHERREARFYRDRRDLRIAQERLERDARALRYGHYY